MNKISKNHENLPFENFTLYSVLPQSNLFHLSLSFLAVPNDTPQNIAISLLNATSAEMQWDPPPFEDQNGVIKLYRLFVIEVDTGRVIEQLHIENTSLMLQKLRPFHVYQYVIAATTVAGLGPFSTPSFFRMPESG